MKNIKIAIHDEVLLGHLKSVLTGKGYSVVNYDSFDRLADEDYSETELVILDPFMAPPGEATGLIDTLKSRSATSRIPILLCSHEDNDQLIISCMNAGASDFIMLPSSRKTLKARIQNLLQH